MVSGWLLVTTKAVPPMINESTFLLIKQWFFNGTITDDLSTVGAYQDYKCITCITRQTFFGNQKRNFERRESTDKVIIVVQ
jgi:hypothetical protein